MWCGFGVSSNTMVGVAHALGCSQPGARPNDRVRKPRESCRRESFAVSDTSPIALMVFKSKADPFWESHLFPVMNAWLNRARHSTICARWTRNASPRSSPCAARTASPRRLHAGDIGQSTSVRDPTAIRSGQGAQAHAGSPASESAVQRRRLSMTKGDTDKRAAPSPACARGPHPALASEPTTHESILSAWAMRTLIPSSAACRDASASI